jgi:hypothetical protein
MISRLLKISIRMRLDYNKNMIMLFAVAARCQGFVVLGNTILHYLYHCNCKHDGGTCTYNTFDINLPPPHVG